LCATQRFLEKNPQLVCNEAIEYIERLAIEVQMLDVRKFVWIQKLFKKSF
jgi:hypothetical protein